MKAMRKIKHKAKDVNKTTRLKKTQQDKSIEIDEAQTKMTTRGWCERQKRHKRPNKTKDINILIMIVSLPGCSCNKAFADLSVDSQW